MRILVAAAAASMLLASTAHAAPEDVACVNVSRPDCTLKTDSLTAALGTSAKLVYLGPGTYQGTFGSGARVELAGIGNPVLEGNIRLAGQSVAVRGMLITGELAVGPGDAKLDDLDLGYLIAERTSLRGRGLTINYGVNVNGGTMRLSSTLIKAPDPFVLNGGAEVTTEYSAHRASNGVVATNVVDPPSDPRPGPGSVLLDRGDPAPLAEREPLEDVTGAPRIGGDAMRRDIGAYEYHPPVEPPPAGNVLVNGGAEQGLSGWDGSFDIGVYGDPFLPTARGGEIFGGERQFFSGGQFADAELSQRLDVTRAARQIDRGGQTVVFSGLLGGYAADPDVVDATALFKDPENHVLGSLSLGPVTREDRARDTTLLRREVTGKVPRRTRAIDVQVIGQRKAGGYTDAYVDQLGLALSFPGAVSRPQDPDVPPVRRLRPFVGARVLTARPIVTRRVGRVNVACPSATVVACSGAVRLGAVSAPFRVARGRIDAVRLRMGVATARRVRRARHLPAKLTVVSHDGQALERRSVVPVTLTAARRRGRARDRRGRAPSRTHRRAAGRSAA